MAERLSNGSKGQDASQNLLDVKELVRSLQRQEGVPDCFKKSGGVCAEGDCFWKEWCLKADNNLPKE